MIITVLDYGLESSRFLSTELLEKNNKMLLEEKISLEKTMSEIKTLIGLIPICSHCKKIRAEKTIKMNSPTGILRQPGSPGFFCRELINQMYKKVCFFF